MFDSTSYPVGLTDADLRHHADLLDQVAELVARVIATEHLEFYGSPGTAWPAPLTLDDLDEFVARLSDLWDEADRLNLEWGNSGHAEAAATGGTSDEQGASSEAWFRSTGLWDLNDGVWSFAFNASYHTGIYDRAKPLDRLTWWAQQRFPNEPANPLGYAEYMDLRDHLRVRATLLRFHAANGPTRDASAADKGAPALRPADVVDAPARDDVDLANRLTGHAGLVYRHFAPGFYEATAVIEGREYEPVTRDRAAEHLEALVDGATDLLCRIRTDDLLAVPLAPKVIRAWACAPVGLDGHRWPCPAAETSGASCTDESCGLTGEDVA